jgi:hypothetical protein
MPAAETSDIRACPICDKLVDGVHERHTLFHCRNFLLKQYYQESNPLRRKAIDDRIERLNERLSLRGKNLLDA